MAEAGRELGVTRSACPYSNLISLPVQAETHTHNHASLAQNLPRPIDLVCGSPASRIVWIPVNPAGLAP